MAGSIEAQPVFWPRSRFQSVSFVLKSFYTGNFSGLGVELGLGTGWVLGLGIG